MSKKRHPISKASIPSPMPGSGTIHIGKNAPDLTPYNPNDDISNDKQILKALLPSVEAVLGMKGEVFSPEEYETVFQNYFAKSLQEPPEIKTFASINYLPTEAGQGVYEWPGLSPNMLKRVSRENFAPLVIIANRVDDTQGYANFSSHPWKRGWRIQLGAAKLHPTEDDLKNIREAEQFIMNCNIETIDARKRDAQRYTSFRQYLAKITRDSLTYDGMATFTDMADDDKVKAFTAISAGNIRLCSKEGYKKDPNVFAVAVDDIGKVVTDGETEGIFTRDDLVFYTRNPRTDTDIVGYGYSEINMGYKLIKGIQDALEMNMDRFTKNSINGMLLAKGMGWNQKQINQISREYANVKRGVSKIWSLPMISVGKEGSIEVLDLSNLTGKDIFYKEFLNMMIGAFCCLYRFPTKRFGYKVSGTAKDSDKQPSDAKVKDSKDDDPGLEPLLSHIQTMINEYLIWNRWPNLELVFTGKNPKEDAREYEFRSNAMSLKERCAAADLPSWEEKASDELKDIGRIMDLCPTDPSLAGVYQTVISAKLGGLNAKKEGEARFPSKTDPAESEEHGHRSGVKRDSALEREEVQE